MPWRMIIDQANAAAESNGRFFNKTNRFAQFESENRFESRIGMLCYVLHTCTLHLGVVNRSHAHLCLRCKTNTHVVNPQ